MNNYRNFIINRINEIDLQNGKRRSTVQKSEIADRVEQILDDKINDNIGIARLENLIDITRYDYDAGIPFRMTYSQNTSLRHLAWFDTFLGEGEADEILKAFRRNNIDPNILKGIKYSSKSKYNDININKDGVNVVIKWTENDGGSPVVEDAKIYYNGTEIYHWFNEDIYWEKQETGDRDLEGLVSYQRTIQRTIEKQYEEKHNKKVSVAVNPDNSSEFIIKGLNKRGQTMYRNEKGRFAKKSLYEGWRI